MPGPLTNYSKIVGCACAGNAGNVLSRHDGFAIPTCIAAREK